MAKLDAATNAFVVDAKLGELEFEADESEVAFKNVKDLTGEWAVVIPDGTAAAPPAGGAAGGEKKEDDKAGQIEVAAAFGTTNVVNANAFTNLNFPVNVSLLLFTWVFPLLACAMLRIVPK